MNGAASLAWQRTILRSRGALYRRRDGKEQGDLLVSRGVRHSTRECEQGPIAGCCDSLARHVRFSSGPGGVGVKVLVFGASGRCGSHFVRLAAAAGHSVTAVVRPQTSFTPSANVNVARGDVLSADFVNATTPGHDVVVSALGMRYRHPWAKRQSPETFTSAA